MSLNKVVLITGAAGFIGGYTAVCFNEAGWQVIAIDRSDCRASIHPAGPHVDHCIQDDLLNEKIISHLKRYRPHVCIHLAGPASVESSFRQPLTDFPAHTLPLLHLLEAVRVSKVETRVLLVSSAAVYGDPESLPVKEDSRIKPISPYGFHKYHQEILLDQYRALYRMSVCKARVFSTYGMGVKRLAVWDITNRALSGDHVLFGTGEESRDYLYITDVARALFCISEQASFEGEAINVASGREIRIIDLAKKIYEILGISENPRLVACDKPNKDPLRWRADTTQLSKFGFEPKVSLAEGLSSTVEWIKSNA